MRIGCIFVTCLFIRVRQISAVGLWTATKDYFRNLGILFDDKMGYLEGLPLKCKLHYEPARIYCRQAYPVYRFEKFLCYNKI